MPSKFRLDKEYEVWQKKQHYKMLQLYMEYTLTIELYIQDLISIYFEKKGTEKVLINEINELLQFHQKLWLCEMIISTDHKKLYTKQQFNEIKRIIKLRNKLAHSVLYIDLTKVPASTFQTKYISVDYRYKSHKERIKLYIDQYEKDEILMVELASAVTEISNNIYFSK